MYEILESDSNKEKIEELIDSQYLISWRDLEKAKEMRKVDHSIKDYIVRIEKKDREERNNETDK